MLLKDKAADRPDISEVFAQKIVMMGIESYISAIN